MAVVAIVQARMGSTRLPVKIMKDLEGYPVLWHVLNRLRYSKNIKKVVLATTILPDDDITAEKAKGWSFDVYRGSVNDLLDRYYQAARKFNADPVVRITADCPLIDPQVVDMVLDKFQELGDYDLVGTDESFSDGLDTSVYSFSAIERAWKEARLPSEREHVGPYIEKHPELFKTMGIPCARDLRHMRWTVDEERDLVFVREVMKRLYKKGEIFYMDDVLRLLKEEPHLMEINSDITRNEGYLKSLEEDEEFLKRSE